MQSEVITSRSIQSDQRNGTGDVGDATTQTITPSLVATAPGQLRVIKRNGTVVSYTDDKIAVAITKAFLAAEGGTAAASSRIRERVSELTQVVTDRFQRSFPSGGTIHIEDIQDQVELALMRGGEHQVARSYVLYREEHARMRKEQAAKVGTPPSAPEIQVVGEDGARHPLDTDRMRTLIDEACAGLNDVEPDRVMDDARRNMYDGIKEHDVATTLVMTARTLIEEEPDYTYVSARLLLDQLRAEALAFLDLRLPGATGYRATQAEMGTLYGQALAAFVARGVKLELLAPELQRFDLEKLGAALKPERDLQFTYLGLQTLYDRYFIHSNDVRFELPQVFFMRVAMGLSVQEDEPEKRAIEFYNLLSSFDYMSSTPTLFNAGTRRPQLSSCFLTTVSDDLNGIYSAIRDNALLSKWAGGLGNDWTPVRALGSYIKGTNGKSQGVVPFLKVVNDTAVAVNQCFDPDTRVHTADGVKALRDIKERDLVLGQRGAYREVTRKFSYNQTDPMVEVRVKHSIAPLKVTAGHPLWAIRGIPLEQSASRSNGWLAKGKVNPEWVDAGDLRAGDYVAQVIPQEVVPVPGFDDDDARMYGILLGDGRCAKNGLEWRVSGNPTQDAQLDFVADYLGERGIHFWVAARGERYRQIRWSAGIGLQRDGTTGQYRGAGMRNLEFTREDLYGPNGQKRIARRFSHLPKSQTLALLQGLLETEGGVNRGRERGREICFTSTSEALAEGVRYQMLRLGVPTAGQCRERRQDHEAARDDGTATSYDIRIPAVPEVAERLHCKPLTKRNWLTVKNWVFSRVRSVGPMPATPFVMDLKVEGDESYMTTSGLAHNGGKRKGAVCAYIETWHLDIEEFLELRKNTGDDRRRTHDMNTANWVPDLFMQRVFDNADWTLFSPNEVPDLHDLYGSAFAQRYEEYEAMIAADPASLLHKRVPAVDLWRKMLSMLFETGHPWITFKDSCNIRSPQQHAGVVHSSNLCTEITLNTSADEIAVCNLGSVNLTRHLDKSKRSLDIKKIKKTVRTAVRMLDNVIDINYYSVPQARSSNMRHRPVGLGVMGFQDALYELRIPYGSEDAVTFADRSMEAISYCAIDASSKLAKERGSYASFEGSLWSRGILPVDALRRLGDERPAGCLEVDYSATLDWDGLRDKVRKRGMRNSNVMAIAPTATIANVVGVSQSIEPTYENLFVKSNLSGEFTVVNPYLVHDLKRLGLWDSVMVNDLKYYDGSVRRIDRVPNDLKELYATAFEVEPRWIVDAASRRQKWIDQAQSLNLYIANADGKKLDVTYRMAWLRGLKTTYYLRSLGATATEKSTLDATGALNAVDAGGAHAAPQICAIDDPECEACQ